MDAIVLALLMLFGQAQTQSTTSSGHQQPTTSNGDQQPATSSGHQQPTTSNGDQQPAIPPSVTSPQDRSHEQAATTQGDNLGEINGLVTIEDIPAKGATVTLHDPDTGYSRTTTTNQKGNFMFDNVAAKEWNVEVAIGDKRQGRNIVVKGRQTFNLDFALR